MFYSQFILAKKGPLGTIWIAAHLERKLRKNQVADTDIGVSVDSILSPDVPIALRLSSHLLLGVVRIYNRKVNYLFDDCSEALLKVKQAFRSSAVDLPPEESKAPYHSITLPETFDLDDFELPDSDIFHGNYVDHHISSREQITLQDTMEGVSYSTSKFGLDERFGDGDASGLDLDEELLLHNIGTAAPADESANPQASVASMTPPKLEEHPEDRAANSETMVDDVDELADLMDYAQAPRTPGLAEEPNLSNIQDASACDDHMESDYHLLEYTMRENAKDAPYENKKELDWCDINSDAAHQGLQQENGFHSSVLEIKESNTQGESPIEGNVNFVSVKEDSLSEPTAQLLSQAEATNPAEELVDEIIQASDVSCNADSLNAAVKEGKTFSDVTHDKHQSHIDIGSEKSAPKNSGLVSSCQQVLESISAKDPPSTGVEVTQGVGPASESALQDQVASCMEVPEIQSCQGNKGSSALDLDAPEKEVSTESLFLRPCSSTKEQPDMTNIGCSISTHADLQSETVAFETSGKEDTAKTGEAYCLTGCSEQQCPENNVVEHTSVEERLEANGRLQNSISQDRPAEKLNKSAESELPAPEKLLSVPEDLDNLRSEMLGEVSTKDFKGVDEGDVGSKTATVRKRSFTESTLTEQSLYSAESSRLVRARRTIESLPDDDDLLSSILVGRKTSALKVKPTPPLSEVTSMKRTRSAPRTGAPKRKVLMDDTMVLHGDTIRKQLTNTEDIRRIRKKAPCTRPEISMIQKQHLEDEIFVETIFTGMSSELASLHSVVYDLGRIRVCKSDVNDASIENVAGPSGNDENVVSIESVLEPIFASPNDNCDPSLETMAELHASSPNNDNGMNHDIEDGNGSGKTNVAENSEQVPNSELLVVRDDAGEAAENPVPSENKLEKVNFTSMENDASQEQFKLTDDVGPVDSQQDVAEIETSLMNSGAVDHSVIAEVKQLEAASLDKYGETNSCAKDGDVNEEGETELGSRDSIMPDGTQDVAAVELLPDAKHDELEYNVHSGIYDVIYEEQQNAGVSHLDPVSVQEYGSMNVGENLDHPEAYQPNILDSEILGSDLHDRDELNYMGAGNNTEFLNVDDDELADFADDDMADAEEGRVTENSGWSSRTRAVSKYLQTVFVKEAECGGKSLSLDNLLIGKSRKEASRMFFETLVLKTRDYIHVEQRNPFYDIAIKPRTRLMKSDF